MATPETLTFEALLDIFEGRLPPELGQAIQPRLAGADDTARADAAWIQAFAAARSRLILEPPPPAVHAALLAIYRPGPLPGLLRRVVARLVFDSAARPAPAGIRSVEARSRQLIFASDLAEVAVTVRPGRQADRLDMNGQVFPLALPTAETLVMRLVEADMLRDVALTNAFGEFSFTELSPGMYTLTLIAESDEVTIEQFHLLLDPI